MSSLSRASGIFCGVPLIRMALCSQFWCRSAAILRLRSSFIRKFLLGQRVAPCVMITDKLGSYAAANRAENSHQPIRRRERVMKRFKSEPHLQRFASIHDPTYNLHYFTRNLLTSADHRELRPTATNIWPRSHSSFRSEIGSIPCTDHQI